MGADDHGLPPDNVQVAPDPRVAAPHVADQHRDGAARHAGGPRPGLHRVDDAGRADRGDAHDGRAAGALEGHLLNWYDTETLAPLAPALRLDGRQRQSGGRAGRPGGQGSPSLRVDGRPRSGLGRRAAARPRRRAPARSFDAHELPAAVRRRAASCFAIGYRLPDAETAGPPRCLALRSAGLGGAARELRRDRARAMCPRAHWFHLGRRVDQRRRRAGADVVERDALRVPDAAAPDAHATPARCWTRSCRMAVRRQMDYGAARGVPWGISESRVQRRRSARHLSVQGVRGAGSRPQARPGRRAGGRALRHRAGGHARSRRQRARICAARDARAVRATSATSTRSTTPTRARTPAPSASRTPRPRRRWSGPTWPTTRG